MNKTNTTLYVAPNGSDLGTGSIDSPFLTLKTAQEKARAIINENTVVTVCLRGGVYPASDNTITLTDEDSDTNYIAYENEAPVIKGGIALDLTKIKKVTDDSVLSRIINKKAADMLYELDVAEYINALPTPDHICARSTPLLFCGDTPMQTARWPRKKYPDKATLENWLYTVHIEHGTPPRTTPFDIKSDYATLEHIKLFWNEKTIENAWLAGYLWHNWSFDTYKVNGYDINSCSVTAQSMGTLHYLCDPEPCYKYRRFFFYNILEEISDPLDYYIDFENKKLYCCLENTDTEIYVATNASPLIKIDGASNVIIDGLSLMYSANQLLNIANSNNVTVKNCTICCCTDDAAEIAACSDINVLNNRIYNAGSGGFIIHNCGNMKELIPSNVLIEGNDFHDVALKKQNMSCALNIWDNMGITIRKNKLHNSQHTLLYIFSGLDTIIEYNEIYDATLDTDDAAAIYWGRTAAVIGTKIRYNYFHDIGQNNSATWCIGAIYTDDLATSAEIYGNLFIRAAIFGDDNTYKQTTHINPTVMLNNGQFVNVHDNIIVTSTKRETPITADMGKYSTVDWVRSALGAYIPGNSQSMGRQMQWREQLIELGFFADDNISPNPIWQKHYQDSAWSGMFELLSAENYLGGLTDANGKKYGIPDIINKFNADEISLDEANSLFKRYSEAVVKKYGEDYTPNVFRRNIIIGMNDEHFDENGNFVPKHIKTERNVYISYDDAKTFFNDIDLLDFTFTANGKTHFSDTISDFDCLTNVNKVK